MQGITYSMNARNIYNDIKAVVTPYELQASAELWRLEEKPSLFIGESKTFWGNAGVSGSPVFVDTWANPTATVDYLANTASTGLGTDTTSLLSVSTSKFAQAIKYEVYNTASMSVFLTLLRGTGTYYDPQTTLTKRSEDTVSSQVEYQRRTLTLEGKYMADADEAQDICDVALARYKEPQGEISITVLGSSSTLLAQILTRQISDRVTVQNTKLGLDADYFINHMEHEITDGGKMHKVTYRLSEATNEDFWVLNYSALGEQSRLGA
jgi:hypothetical protein